MTALKLLWALALVGNLCGSTVSALSEEWGWVFTHMIIATLATMRLIECRDGAS